MLFPNLLLNFVFIYLTTIYIFFNLSKLSVFFTTQEPRQYVSLLYGFSFFIIITNFLYFLFKLETDVIFYFIIIVSTIIFIREILVNRRNIKNYLTDFLLTFIGCLPVLIIFYLFALYQGEQYYVFRGNPYDYLNYISQAVLLKKYSIEQIIINETLLIDYYPYKNMVNFHLDIRPSIGLFFSILNFEKINIFLNSFILKTFAFNLIFFSCYSFFNNYVRKKIYVIIYSLSFTFSFWSIYVYEIDSLAQLFSLGLSILFISKLLIFFKIRKDDNTAIIFELTLILSSLLLIYPEQSVILCSIAFIMMILHFNYVKIYFLKNYKYILKYLIFLIIILLPNYKGTILFIIKQSQVGLTNINNFWGYFGAFILGKQSIILYPEIVNNIKIIIKNSDGILNVFKEIHYLQIDNGYKFYILNILPTLFGMFHLTAGKIEVFNLNLIFLIALNLLSVYIIFSNIKFLFARKNLIEKNLFLSSLTIFIIISTVLILNNSLWGIIKIFFYISFICYFFILFPLFLKKKKTQIHKIILIFLILFPFNYFQYSKNSSKNSMPAMMKPYLKEEIIWGLNSDLTQCDQIVTKIEDFFALKYLGIQAQSNTNLLLNKRYNKSNDKTSCEIIFYNKKFKVIKNEIY